MTGDAANEGSCTAAWQAGFGQSSNGLGWSDDTVVPESSACFESDCTTSCVGCDADWADVYDSRAPLLNECMNNAHRWLGECVPHADCMNEFVQNQMADRFQYISRSGGRGTCPSSGSACRCQFLDIDAFLSACTAKTAFADFRDE